MYKSLYNIFKHWYISKNNPEISGQIYFYADPHFGDVNSQALRGDNVSDKEQIKRINACASKNDTLIILGDVGDVNYLKYLKAGRKILILGNHDHGYSYYEPYFDEIYEGALLISPKIILSHEPVQFAYGINIHGHTHNINYKVDNQHIEVVAEKINYTPICLKHIIKSGILKDIPNIHRETVDHAIINKQKEEKRHETS